MTLRLSTLLVQQLMGAKITTGARSQARTTGPDTITDAGGAYLTDGFLPGMVVYIYDFTTTDPEAYAVITQVAAGVITIDELTLDAQSAEAGIVRAESQSFKDIFTYGQMGIYTGSQPATADIAPTGTLLLLITVGSVALTPGTSTNGLEWDAPVAGVLGKSSGVWSDAGLATGTAGWFRFYTNSYDYDGAGCNFDGAVGTSGAELNLSSTAIVLAATTTIDEFEVTLPMV